MFPLTSLQINITLLLLFFLSVNLIHPQTIIIIHWQFQITFFLLRTLISKPEFLGFHLSYGQKQFAVVGRQRERCWLCVSCVFDHKK